MMRTLLLRLARRIAARYGYTLSAIKGAQERVVRERTQRRTRQQAIEDAQVITEALSLYVNHSGHLTRAYHAGRRVEQFLDEIGKCLATAGTVSW